MEALEQTKKQNPLRRAGRFFLDRLLGGAWGKLAEQYAPQIADAALQDTVEFEPVQPWERHGLRLCDPVEHGFERTPDYTPPEAA